MWKMFTCPADVCECVNKSEAQRKGNKRITKKIFSVFHQHARAKYPIAFQSKTIAGMGSLVFRY